MAETTTSAADTTAATTTASADTTAAAATTSDATTKDSSENKATSSDAQAGAASGQASDAKAGDTSATAPKQADATDGKAKEGEAAKADALDFKLPEGFQADDAALGEFRGLAKEMGLDGAKAQKLVDLYAKASSGFAQRAEAAHAEQVRVWGEAISKDKDLGGDNLATTRRLADAALGRFATPELRALLNESGLGNHPDLVRVFRDIGRALADDTVTRGNASGSAATPANDDETLYRTLYPSMYPKAK